MTGIKIHRSGYKTTPLFKFKDWHQNLAVLCSDYCDDNFKRLTLKEKWEPSFPQQRK